MNDSYINQDYINDRYIPRLKKGDIPKKPKVHVPKTLPGFFRAIKAGIKTFEIRLNDRNFEVRDIMELKEYDGEKFSGESMTKIITYMTEFAQKDGFVVMAIADPK